MTNHLQEQKTQPRYYALLIISLCAAFLFYKYILQVYPSVITQELMREFQLTGAGLGNLAATFYYTYLVTQIFVGFLLDKYSTRWLTASAIFCCALGMILFSQAHHLLVAQLSRALMGAGVAFATVAYMKLAAIWFPPRQYAFIGGLLATAAMAGAVFGQAPLSFLVDNMGWRNCLYIIGWIGFFLALLFALVVRDKKSNVVTSVKTQGEHTPISLKDVFTLFKNKQNWLLAIYGGFAFSPIAIFGGLWGNPFLQQAYELNSTQAASLISLIFIGLGVGSPVIGFFSDRIGNRKMVMLVSTLISGFALTSVLYLHPMPIWLLSFLLFTFGFCLGAYMLVFAIGKELNLPVFTATVIAMINTSDAFLSGLTEPAIGKLLDLIGNGQMINGMHVFSLQSYHLALSVLPLYLFLAVFSLVYIKNK